MHGDGDPSPRRRGTYTWLSLWVSWKASSDMCCSPELEMVLGEARAKHVQWEPCPHPPHPTPGGSQVPEVPQHSGVFLGQRCQQWLVLDDAGRQQGSRWGSGPHSGITTATAGGAALGWG